MRDVVDQTLAKLEDCVADLQVCLAILRRLRIEIHSVEITQAESCPARVHVFSNKLGDLPQGIPCLDPLGHKEVEKVGIIDIFRPLEGEHL